MHSIEDRKNTAQNNDDVYQTPVLLLHQARVKF